MRRLSARRAGLTLLAATIGCASVESPPGGPPDSTAPRLLAVLPESGQVGVRPRDVVFRFDEVIRERPERGADLRSVFLISPVTGAVEADWHRSSVSVKPSRGWRPNTTYTVTMLSGVTDIRGNALRSGAKVVFSTGPSLAQGSIAGTVFDWVAARVAQRAVVEAVARPDSTVYVTATDTTGIFTLSNIPAGEYLVRAIMDANNNRALDARELWDTVGVSIADSARVELLAALRDTIPPRILSAEAVDSLTVRVNLDRALHPDVPVDTSLFTILGADSAVVPILSVLSAAAWDRDQAARRAAAEPAAAVPPPVDTGPRQTVTAVAPSRPSPIMSAVIIVGRPLAHVAEYRVRIRGARGLGGPAATSDRLFTTRAAPRPVPAQPPPPPP